jgi:hypothetical protein
MNKDYFSYKTDIEYRDQNRRTYKAYRKEIQGFLIPIISVFIFVVIFSIFAFNYNGKNINNVSVTGDSHNIINKGKDDYADTIINNNIFPVLMNLVGYVAGADISSY